MYAKLFCLGWLKKIHSNFYAVVWAHANVTWIIVTRMNELKYVEGLSEFLHIDKKNCNNFL